MHENHETGIGPYSSTTINTAHPHLCSLLLPRPFPNSRLLSSLDRSNLYIFELKPLCPPLSCALFGLRYLSNATTRLLAERLGDCNDDTLRLDLAARILPCLAISDVLLKRQYVLFYQRSA
jgi:hypothetical protein